MSTYVYVDGQDGFDRQGRRPVQRRTVDYTATTVRHLEVRDPTTFTLLFAFQPPVAPL